MICCNSCGREVIREQDAKILMIGAYTGDKKIFVRLEICSQCAGMVASFLLTNWKPKI
jgi:hypothetical protein